MKRQINPFSRHNLTLRLIERPDIEDTLLWRNFHRKWFNNSEIITYSEHEKWFSDYLKKEDDYIFIIINGQSGKIGQLSVYGIDMANHQGIFGRFMVNPTYANQGYMKAGALLAIELAKKVLSLTSLILEVKNNNKNAISIYEECGFVKNQLSNNILKMSIKF